MGHRGLARYLDGARAAFDLGAQRHRLRRSRQDPRRHPQEVGKFGRCGHEVAPAWLSPTRTRLPSEWPTSSPLEKR